MSKPLLPLLGLMAAMALFLFPEACIAVEANRDCGSSMCGNVNISFPFRLATQPSICGDPRYELECDNNHTIWIVEHGRFYVQNISYGFVTQYANYANGNEYSYQEEFHSMQAIDGNLSKDDNCSLPRNSLSMESSRNICELAYELTDKSSIMLLLKCTRPMESSSYINASRCPTSSSSHPPASYFYFLDGETPISDFNESCTIDATVPIMVWNISGMSTLDIYKKLLLGFEVKWDSFPTFQECHESPFLKMIGSLVYALQIYAESFVHFLFNGPHFGPFTNYAPTSTNVLCLAVTGVILARYLLGLCCLIALVTYKWRRRHLSADDTIEKFLQCQTDLMPIRYSYREIKRITSGFRDKIGEGGFGSVFKGKLRSHHLVAVKLLGKSKANGEDFISEVATIGRIHHCNVAKLIGFCAEGSKQALIYDFMRNGSLDKILFRRK